jgi:predicted N-acetyltransferase YhbS
LRAAFEEVEPALTSIVPLGGIAPDRIEALLDAAFGAGRKTRTAYRLRTGVAALPGLSFAAIDADGQLAGTLQSWPVAIRHPGGLAPLVLVGPVAVDPARQRSGIGRAMMTALLARADAGAADALMMIGDPDYYDRFFGFTAAATRGWALPGPVERHRLLARVRREGGLPAEGTVIADPAFASEAATA